MKCRVRKTNYDPVERMNFYTINCRPKDYVGRYSSLDARMTRLRRDDSICDIQWFGMRAQKHMDGYSHPTGQGFGTPAYETFERYLKDRKCTTLQLEPLDENAVSFWKKVGYKCDPEVSDCYRMKKYL